MTTREKAVTGHTVIHVVAHGRLAWPELQDRQRELRSRNASRFLLPMLLIPET